MLEEKYKNTLTILINEELSSGKAFPLGVSTLSMAPLIKPEDKIIARKRALDTLKCGDIVVFKRDGELYTHRFLYKKIFNSKIKLITKGDNSLIIDKPTLAEDYLGKVVGIKKGSNIINLESALWKIISRLIGVLSYFEGTVYNLLRKCKRYFLK